MEMSNITDLTVGMAISKSVVFNEEVFENFKQLSSDYANVHNDESYAQRLGFKSKLVHGLLVQIPISTLVGMQLPGHDSVLTEISSKFHGPTYVNDEVFYSLVVTKIFERQKLVQLQFKGKVNNRLVISGYANSVFPERSST